MESKPSSSAAKVANGSRRRSLGSSMTTKNQQRKSVETAWRSLDLERDHFLKLMSLNEKLLRSRQGRRDDKVAKLQSHLTAPEIVEIEAANRHRPNTVDIEVVDADSPDGAGIEHDVDDEAGGNNRRSIESSLSNLDISNSFYGHQQRLRSQTASETTSISAKRMREQDLERQNGDKLSARSERDSHSAPRSKGKRFDINLPVDHKLRPLPLTFTQDLLSRPIKSGWSPRKNANLDDIRTTVSLPVMSSRTFRASTSPSTYSNSTSSFSCHEKQKRQASEMRRSQSVDTPIRRRTPMTPTTPTSSSSRNCVSRYAEDAVKSERTRSDLRNLMVMENDLQFMQLQRRKEALMSDIDVMVKRDRESAERRWRGPSSATSRSTQKSLSMMSHAELMESAYNGGNIADLRNEIRRRKMERMRERVKTEMPVDQVKRKQGETDDEYAARMEKWWRDMRKVRYLRRSSSVRPDLSDVVTLAMAQQTNNNIWRQSLRDNLF